jgi:hypothetical protein
MSKSAANKGRRPAGIRGRIVHPHDEVKLSRKNWILFGAALGCIAVGYGALAAGSITLAPILLVAGYCVLIPWAIMAREGE